MARMLTKLRINEVSAVLKGSNPGAKVMIRKSDDDMSQHDRLLKMFDSVDYDKAIPPRYEQPGDEDDPRIVDDDYKLTGKLKAMCEALCKAVPSLSEEHALYFLLHHPHGRRMAEHLNSISKHEKEPIMNRSLQLESIAKDFGVIRLAKKMVLGRRMRRK
jgi:hypothetical protein